jgi:hypothetical protein
MISPLSSFFGFAQNDEGGGIPFPPMKTERLDANGACQ